ncbi:MAG TPA: N-acetylneuraminate synthase family protein [Caulobacteraceae bacterium]|jgi:sialic acid synthase SpsE|nr:N-acetylneuraminate synthase family protein [Caulobacteraceae bacterium]
MNAIFDNLFVLELANNHWGRLERGLKIIDEFGCVVHSNGVHAAIKLQFRDVPSFIHRQHRDRGDIRYIKKVGATELSWKEQERMLQAVRNAGMVTMVTPFDEVSVDKCVEFGVEILKIASSDIRDRILIEKIASTGKPVIASSGGSNLEDVDRLVSFFGERGVPFALNHCVSIYPSEDRELEMNQIDFLRARYPDLVIGFSTHEKTDWASSVMIAYAKGARTFERHVDIDEDGIPVSAYCTLPHQADAWFKAFHKVVEMCGASGAVKRVPPEKEVRYLDELVRGVYATRDLPAGHVLTADDVFLAVPLVHGQISVREFTGGEVLKAPVSKDGVIRLREIDCDYANDLSLQRLVESRGVARAPAPKEGDRIRVGAV